jgi:hypothetical protein
VFASGAFTVRDDHHKAVRAIYDVVVSEDAAVRAEVQMVLGKDCVTRVDQVRTGLEHMMDVFGDVCNNVDLDDMAAAQVRDPVDHLKTETQAQA